ncbi:MAG: hypothetical protein FWG87_09565 [Defluviitaleaceae bacterium]|nr:hypothetical protein [Defluviitaleaceae bacterium]
MRDIRTCKPPIATNTRTAKARRFFVGDGFIRPEITSLCVNGRYPSPNCRTCVPRDG